MKCRSPGFEDIHALGRLVSDGVVDALSNEGELELLAESTHGRGLQLLDLQQRAGHLVRVGEKDDEILGLVVIIPHAFARSAHVGRCRILIHPLARQLGHGAELMKDALECAKASTSLKKLSIWVAENDVPLMQLLKKSGPWCLERTQNGALRRNNRLLDIRVFSLWLDDLKQP